MPDSGLSLGDETSDEDEEGEPSGTDHAAEGSRGSTWTIPSRASEEAIAATIRESEVLREERARMLRECWDDRIGVAVTLLKLQVAWKKRRAP